MDMKKKQRNANAPSLYSPDTDKEAARRRTVQVLESMVCQKIITQEEAERIENSDG